MRVLTDLLNDLLRCESTASTVRYALVSGCVAFVVLIVTAAFDVRRDHSVRGHHQHNQTSLFDWFRSDEAEPTPENPSDRPRPEPGMLSPWFGLGPSPGKHERGFLGMQLDMRDLFRGTHARRT